MTIYVLDAGALIAGYLPDGAVTTPEIQAEVVSREANWNLESFLSRGLTIESPTKESLEQVRKTTKETGDDSRLSYPDLSVLALALQLSAVLVTDDYSVQNVAKVLEIQYMSLEQDGIKEVWEWHWVCNKCRKKMDGEGICLICGGEGKKKRKLTSRNASSSAGRNG